VTDEQQTPIGSQAGQLGERLASVEIAGQRRMYGQQVALLLTPVLGGQLGGLARARLGAEQDRIEACVQSLQRDPSGVRLAHTALGQTALCVHTCAMGLSVPVT
jgi:hypothetical protein